MVVVAVAGAVVELSWRLQICSAIKILFGRILISVLPCNIHSPLNRTCSFHFSQPPAAAEQQRGTGAKHAERKTNWSAVRGTSTFLNSAQ